MQLVWSKALARYTHLVYVPLRLFISLNWNTSTIYSDMRNVMEIEDETNLTCGYQLDREEKKSIWLDFYDSTNATKLLKWWKMETWKGVFVGKN